MEEDNTRRIQNALIIERVNLEPRIIIGSQGTPLSLSKMAMPDLGSALAAISQVAGILNLGVSAWAVWKIHRLGSKLDSAEQKIDNLGVKLDGIDALITASTIHLEKLINSNTAMLAHILNGQQFLAESLLQLREEFGHSLDAVLSRVASLEARRNALNLQQQMRSLFRFYEVCAGQLRARQVPPRADLRRIVDVGTELRAWLDTRLAAFEPGSPQRLPYFKMFALTMFMEIEARNLLDEASERAEEDIRALRVRVAHELANLTEDATLYSLAVERQAIIEQYVFLTRELRAPPEIKIESQVDRIVFVYPPDSSRWDDGLSAVRQTILAVAEGVTTGPIHLERLSDHEAWQSLTGLPRGGTPERVDRNELCCRLGLPKEMTLGSETLLKLLRLAPSALRNARTRVRREAI